MSEQTTWLSAPETLARLGVADRTLRKWVARGRLHREFGSDGRPRYRREEVERLAARSEPGHPAAPPVRAAGTEAALGAPSGALDAGAATDGTQSRYAATQASRSKSLRDHTTSDQVAGEVRARSSCASAASLRPIRSPSASAASPDREPSEHRERQLLAEIAWLRERLACAQEAEREFRLLLLQSTRTIEALGEKAAAMAASPSARPRSTRLRSRVPAP